MPDRSRRDRDSFSTDLKPTFKRVSFLALGDAGLPILSSTPTQTEVCLEVVPIPFCQGILCR